MHKLLVAMAAGLAAIGSAQAQTTVNDAGASWSSRTYVGAAVAGARNQWTGDWQAGAKIFGGVDIDQNWAVEAGHVRFGGKDVNLSSAPGFPKGEIKGSGSYVAAKYAVPVNERFSAYGKLGAALNERKLSLPFGNGETEREAGVYGAVGVQYALNQDVAVVAEYERYGKQMDTGVKADTVSVGLKYGF